MNLSKNLRYKRVNLKLTQEDVAKKLDISRTTYAGYEKGYHEPDIETLIKIADLFETSIDYLVGRYKNT